MVDYNHPDLKDNIHSNPGEIPGNSIDDDGNGYVDDIHGYDFADLCEAILEGARLHSPQREEAEVGVRQSGTVLKGSRRVLPETEAAEDAAHAKTA